MLYPLPREKKIKTETDLEMSYKLSHKNFKIAFIIRSENMTTRNKDINRNLM